MKVRVIIIDDEPIARDVVKSYIKQINSLELVGEFENAIDSHVFIKSNPVDLIFLDIKMPELSGIEFLRTINNPPSVIITTAYREYALEGYELQIVDYLLKPISFKRFMKAVDHFFDIIQIQTSNAQQIEDDQPSYLYIRDNRKINKCLVNDVFYIESRGEYIRYYTRDNKYMTKGSLRKLENELPDKIFIRIHNSYIIATAHVTAFSNGFVEIAGETLPISRKYRDEVMSRLHPD